MEPSMNNDAEGSQVHSPIHEENVTGRSLDPEDRMLLKEVIGQSLREFAPSVYQRMEQIISTRLVEFEQKHPILTNPQPNNEILNDQSKMNKEKEKFEYKNFSNCSPPEFKGERDPIISNRWVSKMEETFMLCECPERLRVLFAAHQLKGSTQDWWNTQVKTLGAEEAARLPWNTLQKDS